MKPIERLTDDEWQSLVSRALSMPDAPPDLVQRALELWHVHAPIPPSQSGLQQWLAVLLFDSWAGGPVAAGMRALPSEVRQLIFSAPDCDVDLRVSPSPEGYELSGQLLGPSITGSVELRSAEPGSMRRRAALDASGEFRVTDLSSGRYLISVRMGSGEVELPPIDIGPPRTAGGP